MAKYPSLVFHFRVEWGGTSVSFTEVAGLTQELQAVDYRTGDSPDYSMVKMPGLRKYNNITLKRGITKSDNEFFLWLNTVKLNDIERRDITVSLLNEKHEPVMVWQAHNLKGYVTEMEATAMLKLAKDWNVQKELIELVLQ